MSASGIRGRRIDPTPVRGWMDPMLATLVESMPPEGSWIFERKLDGIRALAFRDGGTVRLYSRNKLTLHETFPSVVAAIERLPARSFVLDGEVVAIAGRQPAGFGELQRRTARTSLRYYVFDVLRIDAEDVRDRPLSERKRVLKSIPLSGTLRRTEVLRGDAAELLDNACEAGWEGLIAKREDAPYRAGRARDWLKLKCVLEQELVIGGFSDPKGSRTGFGALLLGYYEGDDLRFAGEVGTGFDHATLDALAARLGPLETDRSPFADLPRAGKGRHFVKPKLVAQVRFSEWTRDGKLRHPTFLGLRSDKKPRDVVRERPAR